MKKQKSENNNISYPKSHIGINQILHWMDYEGCCGGSAHSIWGYVYPYLRSNLDMTYFQNVDKICDSISFDGSTNYAHVMHVQCNVMHAYTTYACMYASNTRKRSPKLDFNTKILLTSWIMHRFQRFLMFWKAECLLFHLETTLSHCFVFVRSKTWHLWKVCLTYWTNAGIYWTNAGSSIPVLDI